MRPRCSSGTEPRRPRTWVRTLEPGSGVDPSCERTSVAPNRTPRCQAWRLAGPLQQRRGVRFPPFDPEVPSDMTARLPFTGNDDADALIAADPLALLIGF